ncbi:MAG: redox-regulated ATPase YchF [Puniceicoccales bacterium]|nr:redox-regulated ATPase YchF [Puniceicoccales bacterium]
MKVGIVGLPNVGKSTLFNALTRTHKAEARNYPFCTIDANVGVVHVPDYRLKVLQELVSTDVVIAADVEFVDIAGLVKGASRGEGLGNKFLATIREMDVIVHLVRCFEDGNVIHQSNCVDGLRDLEIIQTELLLADLESVQAQLERQKKRAKGMDKAAIHFCELGERLISHFNGGNLAHNMQICDEEKPLLRQFCLLTAKPVLYACNLSEDELASPSSNGHFCAISEYAAAHPPAEVCAVSARLEEELGDLPLEEAKKFLKELNVTDSGASEVIVKAYDLLDLASFFTASEKEVRAWTFRRGMLAPSCAGVIHGDFERGFIRAEVVAYDDLVKHGTVAGARAAGCYRTEGKGYAMEDGDVVHFRFH